MLPGDVASFFSVARRQVYGCFGFAGHVRRVLPSRGGSGASAPISDAPSEKQRLLERLRSSETVRKQFDSMKVQAIWFFRFTTTPQWLVFALVTMISSNGDSGIQEENSGRAEEGYFLCSTRCSATARFGMKRRSMRL